MLTPDELRKVLEEIFGALDGEAVCDTLLKAGVPAGPVLDTRQMLDHPHTKHRDMDASLDWYRNAGIPIKFSRTPGSIRSTPPKFGEHGREILREIGFARDEIEALAKDGILVENRRR